jgi:hypothetical protein
MCRERKREKEKEKEKEKERERETVARQVHVPAGGEYRLWVCESVSV